MRITSLAAGLALVLAACGGGDQKAADPAATPPADQTAAPTAGGAAPAAGGTTHSVDMVLEGSSTYKYVPDKLTIKVGDVVRFNSKSGGAHNVQFYPDSIPQGVPSPIKALAVAPPEKGGGIASESMKTEGETYDLSFAGAPTGRYEVFCAPHHMLGPMKMEITVQ